MHILNTTTRMFARSTEEAFPDNVATLTRIKNAQWFEPHIPTGRLRRELEFWGFVALAFCIGFLACVLWGLS
jgi:hypothetical protein